MTLGLTDGISNYGILGRTDMYGLQSRTDCYGQNIGYGQTSVSDSAYKTLGVTTDPTKSGLITKFSGLTLGTVPSEKLGNFYIRY